MRRMLPAVLVLVLGAGMGALAIAGSADDARIKATQFTVGHEETGEEFARCGRRKRALGGGVVPSGSPFGNTVLASGPLDASGVTLNTDTGDRAKQWYAAVHHSGPNQKFRVFAICSAQSKARIAATEFTVGNLQIGEEFARCGKGQRALGGGVVQSGSRDGVTVQASGPLDASGVTLDTDTGDTATQWYAAVRVGNLSGEDRTFRVFAICVADSKAKIKATEFTVESGQVGEEYARCGRGKRALGGGVVQSGSPDGVYVAASGPLDASGGTLDTGDRAKQWYAAVVNYGGTQARTFRVFAICE